MELHPVLHDEFFIFIKVDLVPNGAVATFAEGEGMAAIVPRRQDFV